MNYARFKKILDMATEVRLEAEALEEASRKWPDCQAKDCARVVRESAMLVQFNLDRMTHEFLSAEISSRRRNYDLS